MKNCILLIALLCSLSSIILPGYASDGITDSLPDGIKRLRLVTPAKREALLDHGLLPIVERDTKDFSYAADAKHGSSFSKFMVTDTRTGNVKFAKSSFPISAEPDARTEALALRIYEYYGAEVPDVEIATLKMLSGCPEFELVTTTHFISTIIENVQHYGDQKSFEPLNDQFMKQDGNLAVIEGLGLITAVANWIKDLDFIGPSGKNILLRERLDGSSIIQAIKIDAGLSLNVGEDPDAKPIPHHKIQYSSHLKTVDFKDFSPSVRLEYLMGLHAIMQTSEAEIAKFVNIRVKSDAGKNEYALENRLRKSIKAFLIERQSKLRLEYAEELEETRATYESLFSK